MATSFTDTAAWKSFMIKFGGIAGSVVVVGALFKIMHWPGAGIMLTIGMGTEVVIFLLSALDNFHPEPDWSLVYPELNAEEEDHGVPKKTVKRKETSTKSLKSDLVSKSKALDRDMPLPVHSEFAHSDLNVLSAVGSLDLKDLNLGDLSKGLNNLSKTTSNLNDLSTVLTSANHLSEKMQEASLSVGNFSQSYENSSQVLSESVHILVDSYQDTAKILTDSGKRVQEDLTTSVVHIAEMMSSAKNNFAETFSLIDQEATQTLGSLKQTGGAYSQQIEQLNKNMTALNTAYELQTKEIVGYHKHTSRMGEHLDTFVRDLEKSVSDNSKLQKGMERLNDSIAELNDIYGNMLSTIQLTTGKK
ncbi:MAG: gliding motility protein GldL [Bacteroidales bacterium]